LEKLASRAPVSIYISATIHLNGLPTTLQHPATAVTWQDRKCAVYHTVWHDIGCMGFLNGMVTSQFHPTQHWTTSKERT